MSVVPSTERDSPAPAIECRHWRKQRRVFYRTLIRQGVNTPTAREEAPDGRLFKDQRTTQALLKMLSTTAIGYAQGDKTREADRIQRDNEAC
jgi:hypothetical protein